MIDDEVHQRVEHEARALGEQVRHRLAALAQADVREQRAVAHRNHVVLADEHVRFAELDVGRRARHLRRAEDDEQRVFVLLDLRPLMRVVGVFDGEIVQVELALHLAEQVFGRLVHADPDEAILILEHLVDRLDLDVADPRPLLVGYAVDDSAAQPFGRERCLALRRKGGNRHGTLLSCSVSLTV